MALPQHVRRRPDLDVREVGRALDHAQRQRPALDAALAIIDHERRNVHGLFVELRLRAGQDEAQMELAVSRDVDRAGEAGTVVQLPGEARV